MEQTFKANKLSNTSVKIEEWKHFVKSIKNHIYKKAAWKKI